MVSTNASYRITKTSLTLLTRLVHSSTSFTDRSLPKQIAGPDLCGIYPMEDEKLQQAFYRTPHSKAIFRCIQCGTCSGSCPLTNRMDHAPRELFALIRDGDMTAVLQSNTQWFCLSCYNCMVRCPQEIPVTDLMYVLKQLTLQHLPDLPEPKMPDLYKAFSQEIKKNGKMNETGLMARYGWKHPFDMPAKAILAVKLFKRGRLEAKKEKTKNPDQIRRMMESKTEGGNP